MTGDDNILAGLLDNDEGISELLKTVGSNRKKPFNLAPSDFEESTQKIVSEVLKKLNKLAESKDTSEIEFVLRSLEQLKRIC